MQIAYLRCCFHSSFLIPCVYTLHYLTRDAAWRLLYYVHLLSGPKGKSAPLGCVAYDKRHKSSTARSPSRLRCVRQSIQTASALPPIMVCRGSWLRENAEIEFANGDFVSTSINLKNKSAVSNTPTLMFDEKARRTSNFSDGSAPRNWNSHVAAQHPTVLPIPILQLSVGARLSLSPSDAVSRICASRSRAFFGV